VTHVQKTFSLSERRACRTIDQPRSTQRYAEQRPGVDQALSCRVSELSRKNPRYGYRRVWALLRREGWEVNKKRVHRLWREAGLKVPQRQHKSRRLPGSSENGVSRRKAEYPGHVWSYDFAMDSTEDGRRLKMMPMVDEYSRECLALETERSITSEEVVDTLRRLFAERGAPDYIRAGLRPRVHREGTKALAGRLWGWHSLHRARSPMGECLLGDVHWQATGRAT
jgi:putative transposase